MSSSRRWKWPGIVGLVCVATLLAVLPARTDRKGCAGKYLSMQEVRDLVLQQHGKPCGCADMGAIQAKIDEVTQRLQQFVEYGQNGAGSGGPAPGDKEATDIIGTIQFRGLNQDVCTPVVCDSEAGKCTALWMSTIIHEEEHCNFFDQMGKIRKVGIMIRMVWYGWTNGDPQLAQQAFKAESEINSYSAELAYLEEQLAALKKTCPKPALYPSLADDAAKQIKTSAASSRVGSYAAAM
jgi:hypothetical protein